MAVPCSMAKGEQMFIDICSPSTANMGSIKHWLLVVNNGTDYASGNFLNKKSELKDVMMSLLKDLKAITCINVRFV